MAERRALAHATALAVALAAACAGSAVELVRGPYLQHVTSSSVTFRWASDVATGTAVAIGPAPGAMVTVVDRTEPQLEHTAVLTGLAPSRRWYYRIGSAAGWLAGGDPDHWFATAPEHDDPGPVRLWVLGDSGTAAAGAAAVRDGYLAWAGGMPPDGILMLGDNAYTTGTLAEYTAAVFGMYGTLLRTTPLWPALGNHDALSSDSQTQTGPFFDLFELPAAGRTGGFPSGTEAYWSFELGPALVVCLDTADSSLSAGSEMLSWLMAELASNTLPWQIAFFHHPPYSKGSHDSDDPADSGGRMFAVREQVLPILEAAGVDLVLAGHSHSYERSLLIDGHYGTSDTFDPATMVVGGGDGDPAGDGAYRPHAGPHGGTVYVVAGSAAWLAPATFGHPVMAAEHHVLGSVLLEIGRDALAAVFIGTGGEVLDRFTLLNPELLRDGFESGDTSRW